MIEVIINESDSGQRFDKFLFKYFKEAPSSFVYKMLRKKNIVLNDKKSDGREYINQGDIIKIYMADDTISKFTGKKEHSDAGDIIKDAYRNMPEIVYEDSNIIIVNKPLGMLSQKDKDDSVSLNEICISYLYNKNEISDESLKSFTPSICNRLDRNTSGLVIFAKNYKTAREISLHLKNRTVHKYYKCIVWGKVDDEIVLTGHLVKDKELNKVYINASESDSEIYTGIKPLCSNQAVTLLEILLITGKTHQIRAHLSSINHPIVGDYKYGYRIKNDEYKKIYGVKSQLLCAYKLKFPTIDKNDFLAYMSDKEFEIKEPKVFERIMQNGNMEVKRT